MGQLPPIPFEYDDDPEPTDNVPRACDLGYVEGAASCTVLGGNDRTTFMDEEWADDEGVSKAWITSDTAVYPRDYA